MSRNLFDVMDKKILTRHVDKERLIRSSSFSSSSFVCWAYTTRRNRSLAHLFHIYMHAPVRANYLQTWFVVRKR